MILKFKSYLWDFDGVICESLNVKTEAFRQMYLEYGPLVFNKVVDHHLSHCGVSRFEKFKKYHSDFLGIELTESQIDDLARQFSDIVLEKVVASSFVPGVIEFIEGTQNTIEHWIISGTPHDEMNIIANKKGKVHLFKGIYGSPKKKGDWIENLIHEKKIDAEKSVFIGDAMCDYEAAKTWNIKFLLRKTAQNQSLFHFFDGDSLENFLGLNNLIRSWA